MEAETEITQEVLTNTNDIKIRRLWHSKIFKARKRHRKQSDKKWAKYASETGMELIHRLINWAWKSIEIPDDLMVAIILPVNEKGAKDKYSNYRGNSLLSTM